MINVNKNNFNINFIGIGTPKSATSFISKCLSEHPEVCFSKQKETNYFNTKKYFYNKKGEEYHSKGINWYYNNFSHKKPGQITGEFSTMYLYDKKSPEKILKMFPNVKLLLILRNPTERLFSHYQHIKYNTYKKDGVKIQSFSEIIRKEPDFVNTGLYYQHIQKYLTFFKRENILILLYEDIKKTQKKM